MITNLQTFYISSIDKLPNSNSNSDFYYNITYDKTKKINSAWISDIIVPKAYYLIQSGFNDTFILTENAVDITITLIQGNYSQINLFKVVTQLLNNATQNGIIYNFTNQNQYIDDGKCKFTSTNPLNIPISITFPNINISAIFGFDNDIYNFINSNTLLNSPYIMNLNGANINNLLLQCDAVQNNNTNGSSNVLCSMNNQPSQFLSYIHHDFPIIYPCRINIKDILHFYLTDELNQIISFNSPYINISFTLHLFWWEEKIIDNINDFIKLKAINSIEKNK